MHVRFKNLYYFKEEFYIFSILKCCSCFLFSPGDSLDDEGNSNQQCGGLNTMTSSQVISYHCAPGIQGRYVNIRIAGDNKILEICEVLVNPNPTGNHSCHYNYMLSLNCDLLIGLINGRIAGCWLIDGLIDCFFIDWLIELLMDWLIDRLIDWWRPYPVHIQIK